jgi:hypothetical protein
MRFTLRALLLGVAASSFLAAVCFAMPAEAANLLMSVVSLVLPTVYLAGAVYASTSRKAYCIGA